MNDYSAFFKAAHAYPLSSFPGHTHEGMLQSLLGKKLNPKGQDWITAHTKPRVQQVEGQVNGMDTGSTVLSNEEIRELWEWAGPTENGIVGPMMKGGDFDDDYTLAEREAGIKNVNTGLRRKLDDDEDESGEEDSDEEGDQSMEDAMPGKPTIAEQPGMDTSLPPIRLETLLRFTSTGTLPPQR